MEDSEASNLDGKESIIELKVTYGRERDILRVKNTLQRLPWYKERRYDISLPRGISQNSTQEEIVAVVQTGYREEEYKDFEIFIKDKWKDFSQKFEDLKNIPSLNLRGTYTLILTKYGVGASYDAEKREVTVNIIYRGKEKIMGTIFHEIVHMTI